MSRVYNFSAGPATLPLEVLETVQNELLSWHDTGISIMEMGHRTPEFMTTAEQIEADFRTLLSIPNHYKVLFLQGGARSQFAMVPLNLVQNKKTVDYVDTGIWSGFAIAEARKYCEVNVVASSKQLNYQTIPEQQQWQLSPNSAYVHYVDNETINGVEFTTVPKVGEVPLVADMSSNLLSRPFDISRFGLIYAGAQKNIGPAGLTIVIVRDDLLGKALSLTPTMFNYQFHADFRSMYNTPPIFAWYVAGLVFKWLIRQGGVEAIADCNQRKSNKLYQYLDNNDFYSNSVDKFYRSRMNVVFNLNNENLNDRFLEAAKSAGLMHLKGHKLVGGMRASLYNALPESAVDALIDFMQDFAKTYG